MPETNGVCPGFAHQARHFLTALNGQAVIIVQKNGDAGTYTVATRDCAFFVKVEVVYTNPPMMDAPLQVSVTETHCAQR